jgi:hypothetical protein
MYDKDGEYKVATIGEVCLFSYDLEHMFDRGGTDFIR